MIKRIINKIRRTIIGEDKKVMITSFSDNNEYPSFCLRASKDDKLFESFRRHPSYDCIVDVINEEDGLNILKVLNITSDLIPEIERFKENDLYGNPRMYEYEMVGKISPATLRYIKILYDFQNIFGSLDSLSIVEVGIGYGGQARIINEKYNIESYTLIDLEEVLPLASRYLSNYKNHNKYQFSTLDQLPDKKWDLFISNYAFTELRRNIQEMYLNKVILNSKKGFILYNDINPEEFNSIKKEELLERIPNSRAIPENPKTSPKNCVIIWD